MSKPQPSAARHAGLHRLEVRLAESSEAMSLPVGAERGRLSHLLARAGLPLNTRCAETGLCEGCLVELMDGRLVCREGGCVEGSEPPVTLRACQYEPCPEWSATIRVPMRSRLATRPQVLSTFKINVPRAHDPLWQRMNLGAPRQQAIAPSAIAATVGDRRGGGWDVRPAEWWSGAHLSGPSAEVVLSFAGDHWRVRPATAADPTRPLGAAIDVGTTTIVVMIVELTRGRVIGRASDTNAQVRFGDNVLTRIERCMSDPAAVRELQRVVIEGNLRPLLERALGQAEAAPHELVCITVAGNTTMLHLLAGADPAPMGTAPFEPAFLAYRIISGREFGLTPKAESDGVHETAVHLLPSAAAYVGSDVLAGAMSTGLAYDQEPSLLVDVGTNGEIIARVGDKLVGCATAAGPAFEGAGLTAGMRAGDGAIAHVRFPGNLLTPECQCIGAEPPIGLCGSAYIDVLVGGRRTGLIDPRGRIDAALARRAGLGVNTSCHGHALRIARSADGQDILVTEADIATLLQAKAAIAAGITTLLDRLELRPLEVHRLYLAGGFGMHVDTNHALACGLLPGFAPAQVEVMGNTALAGAYLTLLDAGALGELTRLRRRIEIVELNLDPAFESTFIDHLTLP